MITSYLRNCLYYIETKNLTYWKNQVGVIWNQFGMTDWFHIGKEVCQGCILSHYLFNLYAEYIRRNARLEEAQAVIKIARRNISNLRYTDDITLIGRKWRGTKEPLGESKRTGLKFNIKKLKTHCIQSCHFMANRWENNGNHDRLFSSAQKSLQMVTAAMQLKDTCPLE